MTDRPQTKYSPEPDDELMRHIDGAVFARLRAMKPAELDKLMKRLEREKTACNENEKELDLLP